MKVLGQALWTTLVMSLLLGLAYPLAMTGAAQVLFPAEANGSRVLLPGGSVVGSALIGQDWSSSPRWFQGRPLASGGSNLSPHGKAYGDRVAVARQVWETRATQAGQSAPVPPILLTTSASGLDPHLDLQSALWQVPLVAHARNLNPVVVEALVRSEVVPTGWPWDPAPFVNVLAVNLDLETRFGKQ